MFTSSAPVEKTFCKEGDILFSEGDAGDAAFIVESGSVGIYKMVEGERIDLAEMGEGELFGEMAVLDGSRRMASACALEDSVIIRVSRLAIEKKLDKYEPFMKSLVQILVSNLRNVHHAYMKRPRSINDFINAIAFHAEGFRHYMDTQDKRTDITEGLRQLDAIDAALGRLRHEFRGDDDRRASVLTEADVTVRTPAVKPGER